MIPYERITEFGMDYGEASLEKHISAKECYDRLLTLENAIIQGKVQNYVSPVTPLNINYSSPDLPIKNICQKCRKRLPVNYKNFCPHCGIKLKD